MTVPLYNLTDTWNNGATVFTAIQMNVTNTASAAGSLLMDLQVGASSQFRVGKGGGAISAGTDTNKFVLTGTPLFGAATGTGVSIALGTNVINSKQIWFGDFDSFGSSSATLIRLVSGSGGKIGLTGVLGDGSAAAPITIGLDGGVILGKSGNSALATTATQDVVSIVNQVDNTAQALYVYNAYVSSTNYERGVFDWTTTANRLTIGTQKGVTGTLRPFDLIGASGSQIIVSNLDFVPDGNIRMEANGFGFCLASGNGIVFESGSTITGARDTGIYRGGAAAVIAIGNGSAADASGTILAKTKAGAPTTSDVPAGTWVLIRDTSGATTKLYYNNAGTLQSVALV